MSGTAYWSSETIGKQIQLLKEIAPRVRHIAVLWPADETPTLLGRVLRAKLDDAGAALDCSIRYYDVTGPEDIPAALERIAYGGVDAMWFSGAPQLRTRIDQITQFLLRQRLPSMSAVPLFTDRGGLAHYTPALNIVYDVTADYVDRILKGARPGDLPVQLPAKYEFVINVNTAKAIGIEVPPSLLARADRVIR